MFTLTTANLEQHNRIFKKQNHVSDVLRQIPKQDSVVNATIDTVNKFMSQDIEHLGNADEALFWLNCLQEDQSITPDQYDTLLEFIDDYNKAGGFNQAPEITTHAFMLQHSLQDTDTPVQVYSKQPMIRYSGVTPSRVQTPYVPYNGHPFQFSLFSVIPQPLPFVFFPEPAQPLDSHSSETVTTDTSLSLWDRLTALFPTCYDVFHVDAQEVCF